MGSYTVVAKKPKTPTTIKVKNKNIVSKAIIEANQKGSNITIECLFKDDNKASFSWVIDHRTISKRMRTHHSKKRNIIISKPQNGEYIVTLNIILNKKSYVKKELFVIKENKLVTHWLDRLGIVKKREIGIVKNPETSSTVITDGNGNMVEWLNKLEKKNEIRRIGTTIHEGQHIKDIKIFATNLNILRIKDKNQHYRVKGKMVGWKVKKSKELELFEMRAYIVDLAFYNEILEGATNKSVKETCKDEIGRSTEAFNDSKNKYLQ